MGLGTEWPRGDRVRNKVENILECACLFPARVTALADSVPS